jgi:hypothetical protein
MSLKSPFAHTRIAFLLNQCMIWEKLGGPAQRWCALSPIQSTTTAVLWVVFDNPTGFQVLEHGEQSSLADGETMPL